MNDILTAMDSFLSEIPPMLQVIFAFLLGLGIFKTIKYLADRSAKDEEPEGGRDEKK